MTTGSPARSSPAVSLAVSHALQDRQFYGIDANVIEVEVDVSGIKQKEIIFTPSVYRTRPCA